MQSKKLLDRTNRLQYAYDTAGRLTKIKDYDASTLDYTYDGTGNVLTMDDYHGSLIMYTAVNLRFDIAPSAVHAELRRLYAASNCPLYCSRYNAK